MSHQLLPGQALIVSYGGIYETSNPAREYTLDDFVTLNLEKLDKFVHIRGTGLEELEWRGSSDEEGGSSDDEDDDNSEPEGEDEDEEDEGEDGDKIEVDDEDEEAKAKRHAALTQAEKVRQRVSQSIRSGQLTSSGRLAAESHQVHGRSQRYCPDGGRRPVDADAGRGPAHILRPDKELLGGRRVHAQRVQGQRAPSRRLP